jgi:hypothetical protein
MPGGAKFLNTGLAPHAQNYSHTSLARKGERDDPPEPGN